jgi:hypothetical protein
MFNATTKEKQMKPVPCHSIHCRHYDLAHGQKCEEQVRREAKALRLAPTVKKGGNQFLDKADRLDRSGRSDVGSSEQELG